MAKPSLPRRWRHTLVGCMLVGWCSSMSTPALAGAIRLTDDLGQQLSVGDDLLSTPQATGFGMNFFGHWFEQLQISTNGFAFLSSAGQIEPEGFDPQPWANNDMPLLAPFYADADTRGDDSGAVSFGQTQLDGRQAFVATWSRVGYYDAKSDLLNAFQLVLWDRSDIAAGDFDIEFNYDSMEWDLADGGNDDWRGWAGVGISEQQHQYVATTERADQLLDGSTDGLIYHSLNSNVAGRYVLQARSGSIQTPTHAVPAPASAGCLLLALVLLASRLRQR